MKKLKSHVFSILFLCSLCIPSFATDANSEMLRLVNIITENNDKAFCAPLTATFNDIVATLVDFSKAHPEQHDNFTTIKIIKILAERYPCSVVTERKLGSMRPSDLSNGGVKNTVVVPTGEFSSIETAPTAAILQTLHSTSAHENDTLINKIVENSGEYMPPVLFSLADLLYRQGDIKNAIFWFNAARLRVTFDATICSDASAQSAIAALVQQMPIDLRKKQFDDLSVLRETIERVLKWDETIPATYDHRWISLHGMRAIINGLGNAENNSPLTVPREKWDALAKQNRNQYRNSVDEAIKYAQKQQAAMVK